MSNTSAEAVERLAEAIEEGARAFGGAADAVTRDDMVAAFRGQEVHQRNLASTLRALMAERDAARAALRSIVADCEAQCPHWSIRDDARAALGKNNHD